MDKFFSIVRGFGLKRGPQRWVGGVCGGIAAKLNVDVAFVRIAFLLFGLLPGPAVRVLPRGVAGPPGPAQRHRPADLPRQARHQPTLAPPHGPAPAGRAPAPEHPSSGPGALAAIAGRGTVVSPVCVLTHTRRLDSR